MQIGVLNEQYEGQALVAATPDTTKKLIKMGFSVVVEAGAGVASSYYDNQYVEAGARIVTRAQALESDVVICIDAPPLPDVAAMTTGSILISRMEPGTHPELIQVLEENGLTALALDMVPRISRAQALDVRSSLMNVAGYRAVIEAANTFGRVFSGQVTAAGKVPPAQVYVIGVGVAGLSAIGTAGSLGAEVSATDVRSDVADQVQSLGATFVEIPVRQESTDGYAKELDEDDQAATLAVYAAQAAKSDIVITTAQVPNRPAPLLLTAEAVAGMKPGSVVVDMGASVLGGNCELSQADSVVVTENGVTILGYTDLASRLPGQASQLFSQNIVNLMKLVVPAKDGEIVLDEDDVIVRNMTVTLDGDLMYPPPPVQVSAAPQPAKETPAAQEKADPSAITAQEIAADEEPSRWKGLWWKVLLGVLAVALVLVAPAEMTGHFVVFELAVVVGFYVITGVSHSLHTPLMSVTNAISGIIIVGAILLAGSNDPLIMGLSFVAMAIASINIFGGFLVTHRMLKMFEKSSDR